MAKMQRKWDLRWDARSLLKHRGEIPAAKDNALDPNDLVVGPEQSDVFPYNG